MRLFKSFSNHKNKTAAESVNPQTAAILMSYGFSGTKNSARQKSAN
ncbi:hypothetical protein [Pleurocapsa sp. FMAR1]|nr:hypothetical protein [Pleurocapsa sp. FMAR1]